MRAKVTISPFHTATVVFPNKVRIGNLTYDKQNNRFILTDCKTEYELRIPVLDGISENGFIYSGNSVSTSGSGTPNVFVNSQWTIEPIAKEQVGLNVDSYEKILKALGQ